MRRSSFATALLGFALWSGAGRAEPLAVADFSYVDTSGETAEQSAAHARRLDAFMTALRRDVGAVALSCGTEPCASDRTAPDELLRAASATGAKVVVIGGIHKLSTLVEWAKVQAIDVATDRVVADRLLTFRGDNDEAWARAESFIAAELQADLPAPTALAVFDFELEDYSAAEGAAATPAEDATALAAATEAVRQRLATSGRYRVVATGTVDAPAAKAHALRDCDGCEAAIAHTLGAAQSLVGVVRRISRTEYMIRFAIRDAATGAPVAEAKSGLRMGADYSWDRGAVRLAEDRLLGEGHN